MENNFYREFEECHYASREHIKKLRSQYLEFIEPLKSIYETRKTYDIGCGRGEWLELTKELDFEPFGVDLDEGMLKACREKKLPVLQGDAIEYLKTLESESHIVITAFHVVEHISFENLLTLVREGLRVLKPGGMLILETPNPENIAVATENFYKDPTHIKPIPSSLLAFLPEYYGYARTKILRINENKEHINIENITLFQVITEVSPDYAIVAQKEACNDIMSIFDKVFAKEFGWSLFTLAEKFETRLQNIEYTSKNIFQKIWSRFKNYVRSHPKIMKVLKDTQYKYHNK